MKVEPNEGQQSRHSITAHLEWYAGNWVCVINLECGITFPFSRLTLSLPLTSHPPPLSLSPLSLPLTSLSHIVCLESRAADHATAGPLQHHTATVLLLLLWRQGHYFSITSYHCIIMYINLRALCNHHGVNCTTGSWLARHSIPQWMA